jgi:hypothetical protein
MKTALVIALITYSCRAAPAETRTRAATSNDANDVSSLLGCVASAANNKAGKADKKRADIPDSKCPCVTKRLANPGSPPMYCLPPTVNGYCDRCQTWVDKLLASCK